jgi:chromosome partitioning protein
MPVVVSFVSQKGGVGKSTLARGLAALIAHAGKRVRIADLDAQQGTVSEWGSRRTASATKPKIDVRQYGSVTEAVQDSDAFDVLVIDAAGGANTTTLTIATATHLVVQPTGPSIDDLRPGVLLFHELVAEGIPRERLTFAICRTLNVDEERDARAYLYRAGYDVLDGALPERAAYRAAQNGGRAITETDSTDLNAKSDALMLALLARVASEIGKQRDSANTVKKRKDAKPS